METHHNEIVGRATRIRGCDRPHDGSWIIRFVGCSLLLVLTALPALSQLGATAGPTPQAAQGDAKATVRVLRSTASHTVREVQDPSGMVTREYISSAGKIFAVAWQGPTMPDLQKLFGDYYETFSRSVRFKGGGRRAVVVSEPGLVVQSAGHVRWFFGAAYLPDQLPDGLSAADIK